LGILRTMDSEICRQKQLLSKDRQNRACDETFYPLFLHFSFDPLSMAQSEVTLPPGTGHRLSYTKIGKNAHCSVLQWLIIIFFSFFLGRLPHKHKLVIAGNHELSFDKSMTHPLSPHGGNTAPSPVDQLDNLGFSRSKMRLAASCPNIRDSLTNATYLEDSGVELYGLNFYGTPW